MEKALLRIRQLSAGYGDRQVLNNVDLSVGPGEWFALLGPNGSGKTTLLHCVSGQLAPVAGTVHVAGQSMLDAPQLAKGFLGYAHPPDRLPGLLTGRQCLEVYAAARRLPAIGNEILDLAERFRLAPLLDHFVDTYSLGTRQKLSVLLALIGHPPLILLDEAFNGLDPMSALILKQNLRNRVSEARCTLLLATHALDVVLQNASGAALLLEGKLVRTWDKDELGAMREGGIETFESAIGAAAEGAASVV